jgi:glycosyltransferase involved in cell wall biosynthesis
MRRFRAALAILRSQGMRALLRRVGEQLRGRRGVRPSLVRYDDALAVDWSVPHPAVANPRKVGDGPLTVAWIMSPPGETSGGHQNIYRFISYLEAAGHRVRIYLYSANLQISAQTVRAMTESSSAFANNVASVEQYSAAGVADDVDAIFATGWETAYPAFRDASSARRLYFVQDFEPYFYAVGTESVLAENTYRFGFAAITAGGWLARKLSAEYGMTTRSYEFAADREHYNVLNTERRNEVFFYARPGTERRGFELGLMALDLFARERPDYTINLAGWDVREFTIPFRYRNLGSMPIHELNEVYNRCAVGLVLSMTNMSLLPLELMAAGVIPVVNDGANNVQVSDNPYIEYSPASPRALADRLIAVVDRTDLPARAQAAADSLDDSGWTKSGAQFVSAFESVMRG